MAMTRRQQKAMFAKMNSPRASPMRPSLIRRETDEAKVAQMRAMIQKEKNERMESNDPDDTDYNELAANYFEDKGFAPYDIDISDDKAEAFIKNKDKYTFKELELTSTVDGDISHSTFKRRQKLRKDSYRPFKGIEVEGPEEATYQLWAKRK